jgi:hypothetical protein
MLPLFRCVRSSEITTLVAWTDAGAPEGDVKDKPAPVQFQDGWSIKPDVVVEMMNAYPIPASGTIDYLWVVAKTNFKEDMWVTAAEIRPGNRAVSHHMRVYILPPGSRWLEGVPAGVPVTQKQIAQYAQEALKQKGETGKPAATPETFVKWNPGLNETNFAIDGAAKFIPKGSDIVFQMHYTTNGKPTSDKSRVGFVLAKNPPKLRYLLSDGLSNSSFVLQPGDSNAEVVQDATVQQDIKLVWLQPHMHLRGKDFKLTAYYPSGESEVLLNTKFDFNWQIGYEFEKPVVLPKGTRLVGIAHFDNSANNPFNPDPKASVKFGPQSWDEMSVTFMSILVDLNANPERVLRSAPSNGPRQTVVPLD